MATDRSSITPQTRSRSTSEGDHAALERRIIELEAQLTNLKNEKTPQGSTADTSKKDTSKRDTSKSDDGFRLLAEYSTDMISRHAADGTYLYVSPACRQILGREPQEIIGQSAYEFMFHDDRPSVRKVHDIQLQEAKPNDVTYRVVHPAGQAIWVETTTHCVTDENNNVLAIHAATRNVNDRVLAQQALVKSEAEYRSLIECATDIIFRLDENYRILYLNSALPPEARQMLLGTSFFDRLEPQYHPHLMDIMHRVFVRNEPVSAELKVIPVTCESQWYAFRFAPIQEEGKTVAATVMATDISHRKQTDQALLLVRAAIENVQDAVIITSPDLDAPGPEIIYVNKAFEKMTGYAAQEIQGQSPRILQGPQTDRSILKRLREQLNANQVFHGETINYKKDGSEYHLQWDISPICDANGKVINYVSIQRDITEQRRQEAISRQHQGELAHVGRLSTMGEMASGLAHELNQPLTAITNYTRGCLRRLAASPHPDPKIAQAIELAALQADRAGQIIRRLRQFIRKRVPQHVPVAINNVANDAITLIASETKQHQIRLHFDFQADLPMVKADHIQIEQVVINLLRNAFEALTHLPVGDREVTLYIRAIKDGVRLSVKDNGSGMDHETALRIFEPFFTTKNRGIGMGLPICQTIIESHCGLLWADQPMYHQDKLPDHQELFSDHTGGLFHFWLPQISVDELLDYQNTPETMDNFL